MVRRPGRPTWNSVPQAMPDPLPAPLRLQVPTFFISGGDERGDQVVPTLTVTVGIGF